MFGKKSEKGQAIVMIVFVVIGVFGLIALTVDGGMAFMDRRRAQGAVDSAAWAAGLTNSRHTLGDMDGDGNVDPDVAAIEQSAMDIVNENGYFDDTTRSEIHVNVEDDPSGLCPPKASPNVQITVEVTSYVRTFFAPIIGVEQVTNRVRAVTRACGTYDDLLFGGNAIVGLGVGMDAGDCAFDSDTGSATWNVHGGGISSNNCAVGDVHKDNVNLNGHCVAAVDGSSFGASAPACTGSAPTYGMDYVNSIMPSNPCDGTAGDVGIPVNYASKNDVPEVVTFENGIYCVSNFDVFDSKDIRLKNATLYVTDQEFDLKFAGGGGFSGTPTYTGEYSSFYLVVQPPANPADWCTRFTDKAQVMWYRGNGVGSSYGTILAPAACLDLRGNGDSQIHGQTVGNVVTGNGNAEAEIWYIPEENRRDPQDPNIELVK